MDGSWIAEGFLGSGDLCVRAILSGEMRRAESVSGVAILKWIV